MKIIKEGFSFMSEVEPLNGAKIGGQWRQTSNFEYAIGTIAGLPILAFHRRDKNYLMLRSKAKKYGINFRLDEDYGFIFCPLGSGLDMLMSILEEKFW